MQCCLTPTLRCRLNTTLSLIQPLLKFMRERNPLVLMGFGSVPGRELCQLWIIKLLPGAPVFSLEDSHLNRGGIVLLKPVRSEKIKAQGRAALAAGAEQNQPQCNGCAAGFPLGKLTSPPEVMAMRKATAEERTQVTLGLEAAVPWLGERMHITVHALGLQS